jgi:hypothetical protein
MRTKKTNGYILHEDADRVIIATGFTTRSKNAKTGEMIQVWILVKSVNPVQAIKSGLDHLICGHCPHRGYSGGIDRVCYVRVEHAPLAIWRAWQRGRYPTLTDMSVFSGRSVRFGAYGDPCHIPLALIESITSVASGWTGYTHQWRKNPKLKAYFQASVDSVAELAIARLNGWGTFRLGSPQPTETECANSRTGVSCVNCQACNGTLYSIAIDPHGIGARHASLV